MDKVPLILFSGGMDSSYLLHMALVEGDVEVLYISGAQSQDKIRMEKIARRKIIDYLEKLTGNNVRKEHSFSTGEFAGGNENWAFRQAPMWLFGALNVVDSNKHSVLNIGYVAGDQIASNIPYISQAWDNLMIIAREEPVPIAFPLSLVRKSDILPKIDPEVFKMVWVCEMPVLPPDGPKVYDMDDSNDHVVAPIFVACGKCPACDTRDAMLFIYQKHHDGFTYEQVTARKKELASAIKTEVKSVVAEALDVLKKDDRPPNASQP